MSFEEDERNRRQLREIEDLRMAMRSRYIPIAWIKKNFLNEPRRAGCQTRAQTAQEIIDQWREENERNGL